MIVSLAVDALVFIGLSWAIWRLLRRSFPIAVVPIVIGLSIAAWGGVPDGWGVPSALGDRIGWIGVLLLAFTAGLETRQHTLADEEVPPAMRHPGRRAARLLSSAALALALPFAVGTLAAYAYFTGLPGWAAPNGDRVAGALAIGLCLAVSALPVLIGIVRELGPLHRPLTRVAVNIAVVDDAALWTGLALLLLFAGSDAVPMAWSGRHTAAVAICIALVAAGSVAQRRDGAPPAWAVWLALPVFLAAGAWASSQLGLHALLGAYFAGAMVPPAWTRRLPVERLGQFALLGLAPLFFGHSGMKIDGEVLGWASLQAMLGLLAISVAAKLAAVMLCPPVEGLSKREVAAIGALLQCKGLMEIVAATILRDKGLLSEHAFAALVTLAVASTLLTGPLFRALVGRAAAQARLAGGALGRRH